jgi:uncharacterized membrane protein YbhN (UPF0104 family)
VSVRPGSLRCASRWWWKAFGDHLWLPVLIVIVTLAGIIGGVSPSPGGIGVVEAA